MSRYSARNELEVSEYLAAQIEWWTECGVPSGESVGHEEVPCRIWEQSLWEGGELRECEQCWRRLTQKGDRHPTGALEGKIRKLALVAVKSM